MIHVWPRVAIKTHHIWHQTSISCSLRKRPLLIDWIEEWMNRWMDGGGGGGLGQLCANTIISRGWVKWDDNYTLWTHISKVVHATSISSWPSLAYIYMHKSSLKPHSSLLLLSSCMLQAVCMCLALTGQDAFTHAYRRFQYVLQL